MHAGAQIHAGHLKVYEDVVGRGIALGYGARLQHSKINFGRQVDRTRLAWPMKPGSTTREGLAWWQDSRGDTVQPQLSHEAEQQHVRDMISLLGHGMLSQAAAQKFCL